MYKGGGLPTLLKKGYVIPPAGSSKKEIERINNMITVEYVLGFIGERIPINKKIAREAKTFGDKVIVLKSDTGSGKSTVLPAKLYETFFDVTRKNIAVTQPRVLTAVDIPSTITAIPTNSFLELDKNIGYNTQTFKRLPIEKGIIFSTIGVVTQQLITMTDEEFMKKYQFVIIDEVHERDTQTDTCLFLLKRLVKNNFDNVECPLIILTSATFDETIFMDYFAVPTENYIQVVGMTYPIERVFPKYNITDVVNYAITLTKKLHLENPGDLAPNNEFRDIMVFVSTAKMAEHIFKELMKFNVLVLDKDAKHQEKALIDINIDIKKHYKGGAPNRYILPIVLNSDNFKAGGLEYQNLFSDINNIVAPLWKVKDGDINITEPPYKFVKPSRRIIIASNVAETGVTIDTLKYCVDIGYRVNIEYQPYFNCTLMNIKNVTLGSAIQRKGRVGRKSPGVWHPCYTEEVFDGLSGDNMAEITVSDPTDTLLSILIKEKNCDVIEDQSVQHIDNPRAHNLWQKFRLMDNAWYRLKNLYTTDISSTDFIELPPSISMSSSIEKLHVLGFIDDKYDISMPGYVANQIRFIGLESKKMILAGYYYGAYILDLVTISAFVTVGKRKIFSKDFKLEKFVKVDDDEFDFYNKVVIGDEFINCVFILNSLQKFISTKITKVESGDVENGPEKSKKLLYPADVVGWCAERGIIYDGILKVIELRDTIIENMITIGLDPYKNTAGLIKSQYNLTEIFRTEPASAVAEIKKIKQCIFEGFKYNILYLNGKQYTLLIKNVSVVVKSKILPRSNKPNYIITSDFVMSQSGNGSLFGINTSDYISILDNYVAVDQNLFKR